MSYQGHLNSLISDEEIQSILLEHDLAQFGESDDSSVCDSGILTAVRKILIATAVKQLVGACKSPECPTSIPEAVRLVDDEVVTQKLLNRKYPAIVYIFKAEGIDPLEPFGEPVTDKQWAFLEAIYHTRVSMINQYPTGEAVANGSTSILGEDLYEPADLCVRYNAFLHETLLTSDAFSGEFQAGILSIPSPDTA